MHDVNEIRAHIKIYAVVSTWGIKNDLQNSSPIFSYKLRNKPPTTLIFFKFWLSFSRPVFHYDVPYKQWRSERGEGKAIRRGGKMG